jgi:hypothetical protein
MYVRKSCILVLLALIFIESSFPLVYAWEIDEISTVTRIVDGDSFFIVDDEVRLADVSAPEWNEYGGSLATSTITGLIEGELLYLDTDQRTGRGPYGRLIAVVYIEFNSTHYLNVNQALLERGVVSLTDYSNNEFSPSTWTLYTRYAYTEPTIIDSIPSIVTDLFTSLVSVVLMFGLYRFGKPKPDRGATIWRTGFSRYSLILLALIGIRAISLYYSVSHIIIALYMALYAVSFIGVLLKKKAGSILVIIVVSLEILLLIRMKSSNLTILWNLFLLFLAVNEIQLRRTSNTYRA